MTRALAFRTDDRLQPSRQLGHNKQTHPITQKPVFLIHREKENLVFVPCGQAKQPLQANRARLMKEKAGKLIKGESISDGLEQVITGKSERSPSTFAVPLSIPQYPN